MIDPKRINELFKDCLFKNEELIDRKPIGDYIEVNGITLRAWLNPIRVEKHKNEVISILDEMHPLFKEGWTFLNFCHDKNENLWTGNHSTMDELLCLGLATKTIEYCCDDREMWKLFPMGMPYIRIL